MLEVYPYVSVLRGCHIDPEYVPSDELAHSFELTQPGERLLSHITDENPEIDPASLRLAVAVTFSHDDIFVDVETTEPESLRMALDLEIKSGAIKFPQEYGRLLYDRFFDLFPHAPSELSYEQTRNLIEGTPTAAYQMGTLTVGPLGAVTGKTFRMFPPIHSAPLWHCPDLGCSAIHSVKLGIAPSAVSRAVESIEHRFKALRLAPSEWNLVFRKLSGEQHGYYGDSCMPQLPYLLADGFSEDELRHILQTALELDPQGARTLLSPVVDTRASAEKIAHGLSQHATLQCLLILDEQLVGKSIEAAVLTGKIAVPATEKRRAFVSIRGGSWWDLTSEVGALGLRSVTPKSDFAVTRLLKLLTHIGTKSDGSNSLEWELRFASGDTLAEKLAHTIQSMSLTSILRKFVLASSDSLRMTVDFLQPMHFVHPINEVEESALIERILWKLGFAVEQHPPALRTFWTRTSVMKAAVEGCTGRLDTHEEESTRSAAVNYFVSLEDLLDQTLSFTGWALFHNHYSSTNPFCFSLEDARSFVATRLDSAGTPSQILPNGHNTLYPLLLNIGFLADLIESSATPEAAAGDVRSSIDLPEFYNEGAVEFPFTHYTPLYDLHSASVAHIVRTLREVAADLAQIDMPNLRNRLEHKRPDRDFPQAEEINSALDTISKCVDELEVAGLVPLFTVYQSQTRDAFGRTTTVFHDYQGRESKIAGPTGSRFGRLPGLQNSQVVMTAARLQTIPDCLRFTLVEESSFKNRWANYPKRHTRTEDASVNNRHSVEQKLN